MNKGARWIVAFVGLLWVTELIDVLLFGQRLNQFGIIPRMWIGLPGILFAPMLHGGFGHLIANTVPLLICGLLISLQGPARLAQVTRIVWLLGGALVWLFAPSGHVNIGASGVIFGYMGYLLFHGVFSRKPLPIVLSLVCAYIYGGYILPNVLPRAELIAARVSWYGHLFGFASGILAARSGGRTVRKKRAG